MESIAENRCRIRYPTRNANTVLEKEFRNSTMTTSQATIIGHKTKLLLEFVGSSVVRDVQDAFSKDKAVEN